VNSSLYRKPAKNVHKYEKCFAAFRLGKATLPQPAWMNAKPIFPAPLCLKLPNLPPIDDNFLKKIPKATTEHKERITQKKQLKSKLF
jgi:hypothetical protein